MSSFKVVINHEEQYSIIPTDRDIPSGWRDVGKAGSKDDCIGYIERVWTDLSPAELRRKIEELRNL